MNFRVVKGIDKHWEKIKSIIKRIPSEDCNEIIGKIIDKYKPNTKELDELCKLRIVLDYPKYYKQTHCFDKYLNRYYKNRNFEKFIITKFEQSGGTFEICLYSYFSARIVNNICVICLMNFNNQKDQLTERFDMFNAYLEQNGINKLKIKYIREFKKSDDISDSKDIDIIVCLYNSSSMKITFEKVCFIAHINNKKLSFAYDEIDIPESQKSKSKLYKIHTEILEYYPSIITNIFGVSATTLGDIPGGFLKPTISDIIFKPPSESWSGIGHPDVKLLILPDYLKHDLSAVIKEIIKNSIKIDGYFLGNLYSDIINIAQEKSANILSSSIKDLVIFVFNGTTSNEGGKFTIWNSPIYGNRYDTKKDEFTLDKCFKHIKECLDNKTRNKFIFIDHNMVLRGISIKGHNIHITDEIIFKQDTDVASSSQKYQRIAGLDLSPRRIYGDEHILEDILEYQLKQTTIYTECEIESQTNPEENLCDFINRKNILSQFNSKLSRNPTTKNITMTGKVPLVMDVTRYLDTITSRDNIIKIIEHNIKTKIINKDIKKWKSVIKNIKDNKINKNQAFILDKHADSIIQKHWLLHYNNMKKSLGSSFSAGTDEHSRNSLCYIGIMKNKSIKGYGKCLVVFTDKRKKTIINVSSN